MEHFFHVQDDKLFWTREKIHHFMKIYIEESELASFEKKVLSAHRTPDDMREFAINARSNGIKVVIAGAGGAAHLPGMTASYTTLPVIGVPVKSKSLDGMDSLLSIVQMPKGVPVATVSIGNSANAALLALQMLAIENATIAKKLEHFRLEQSATVKKMKV